MRILGAFLAAVVAILVFTGCTTTGNQPVVVAQPGPPRPHDVVIDHHHPGPPPHAPAHGYRHKHADGCELRYDRVVGCYVVVGYADYYYNDGAFFRYSNENWEISAHVGSGWASVETVRVPDPLVVKYKGHGHGKDNKGGKGKGKNKHSELVPTAEPILEARWGKF